jgi:hypothetical protein
MSSKYLVLVIVNDVSSVDIVELGKALELPILVKKAGNGSGVYIHDPSSFDLIPDVKWDIVVSEEGVTTPGGIHVDSTVPSEDITSALIDKINVEVPEDGDVPVDEEPT